MKLFLTTTLLLLLLLGFNNLSAQSHIDNNYKFGSGSGTYLLTNAGATSDDYITMTVSGSKVTGRIRKTSSHRLQGNFTGTIANGVVHGKVNWSVAPEDLKKATFFSLYKSKAQNNLQMSFYDDVKYKANNRIRSKYSIVASATKKSFATSNTTTKPNTTQNDKVKVRVDYKFIYLSSSMAWDGSFANFIAAARYSVNLYGTGSVRAYSETSSGTTELKAIGNAQARVFDIPKSRATTKFARHYFDSRKNRSWGGGNYTRFGFYTFAKDAELEKGKKSSSAQNSDNALIPVNRRIEFEVNRAALEGKAERVAINGQAHLSNKAPGGDIVFGNIHRTVYLHELTKQSKLTNNEQLYNRKLEGLGHGNHSSLVDAPYYFFAMKATTHYPLVMIAFTVEIID